MAPQNNTAATTNQRRFLSIGEAMVEMAPNDDGSYAMGFAGDTFNTAWYARQLAGSHLDIGYFTAIGDDAASDEFKEFTRAAGITPEFITRNGVALGLYLITLDNGERSFSYWRSASAARSLADDLTTLPNLNARDMAFFSGITLAILPDAGRERLLSVLASARAAGVTIAFDPNLRPRLWRNTEEMCNWIMRGAAVADMALPSFDDEADFFKDADKAATAKRYADAGAGLVVVKDGPLPVMIAKGAQTSEIPAQKASAIVDTTAAGDSFNARFLVGLLDGETPDAAATSACALSCKVIAARGALVSV